MSAQVFDIGAETPYDGAGSAGVYSDSPCAVVALFPLAMPVTFDRHDPLQRKLHYDHQMNFEDAVAMRGGSHVIFKNPQHLSVSGSKSSHTKSCQIRFPANGINYLYHILPGDWIAAWIVPDKTQQDALVDRLRKLDSCNDFNDGFKFVGRVHSVRKTLLVSGGTKIAHYEVNCSAFGELDCTIFADPRLTQVQSFTEWMTKAGVDLNTTRLINQFGFDINTYLPFLVDLFVGTGLPQSMVSPGSERLGAQAALIRNMAGSGGIGGAKKAFMIPSQVGQVLGKTQQPVKSGKNSETYHGPDEENYDDTLSTPPYGYADILERVIGLQKYAGKQEDQPTHQVFTPTGADKYDSGNTRHTDTPMLGSFLAEIPFTSGSVSLWSLLNQYVNPTVNELYTAFKVNPAGKVVPTLVFRQIPFSTEVAKSRVGHDVDNPTGPQPFQGNNGPMTTKFKFPPVACHLDQPRWRIPEVLLTSYNLGRSDSMRFNMVDFTAQVSNGGAGPDSEVINQRVRNPPIVDDLDISRSGLRHYQGAVNCSFDEAVYGPRRWMEVAADFLMGQHLTISGDIICKGIYQPIAEGDCLEIEDLVFHIEQVSHIFSISESGNKSFVTQLVLTNGMYSEGSPYYDSGQGGTTPQYPMGLSLGESLQGGLSSVDNEPIFANDDAKAVLEAGTPATSTNETALGKGLYEQLSDSLGKLEGASDENRALLGSKKPK